MTTTIDYDWERLAGYRPVPGWSAYAMSVGLEVWSMPRQVRCKGGRTRQTAAKRIKPSDDGRVTLCQDGKIQRYHVQRDLYPRVFPELAKERQVFCRKGHPLMHPINPQLFGELGAVVKVAYWGTLNRICLWCHNPPEVFASDNTYSMAYGVAVPEHYSGMPARPKVFGRREGDGDRDGLDELEWGEHGFVISKGLPW
ncbi:hypothetical protein ACRU43_12885 [Mycobacterium colombiense]